MNGKRVANDVIIDALWYAGLDYADEEIGSVEDGQWYGILIFDESVLLCAPDTAEPARVKKGVYVVVQNGDGIKSAWYFENVDDARTFANDEMGSE
jgi:hypothetical protein